MRGSLHNGKICCILFDTKPQMHHWSSSKSITSTNNIFPGNLQYLYSLLYFISFTWPLGPFDSLCKNWLINWLLLFSYIWSPTAFLCLHCLPRQWQLWSWSLHRGHVAPGHKGSQAMAGKTLYEMLGLEASAPLEAIQRACLTSAKKLYVDKNSDPDATVTFQKLNTAYQMSRLNKCDSNGSCHSLVVLANVSLFTRQNTFSLNTDIINITFLVFMEHCATHYNVNPDLPPQRIKTKSGHYGKLTVRKV